MLPYSSAFSIVFESYPHRNNAITEQAKMAKTITITTLLSLDWVV